MIVQPIDLNMIPDSPPVILHCDQYDEGTGRISAHLYDGDQSYAPTNATVMIQGTKPDGKGFQYAATISGNVVTADLTKQMTAVAGNVRTQIVVTESSGRTGTFVFTLAVQRSALPDDTDMSESEYQLVEQMIEDVEDAVVDSQGFAETAEAWAQGTRDGQAIPSTDPAYNKHSKYNSETSQAWAEGKRGSSDIPDSDPAYNNHAKYWAGVAEQYAQGGLIYKGSIMASTIPVTGMDVGDMYNIRDSFITDSRFEEGAGIKVNAGTNIAYDSNDKWDLLATGKEEISGHTIVDSTGTEMTARTKLKFMNSTVTDDPTNDVTVITPQGSEVTYPISTANGGTGNSAGYIRTGQKSGTSIGPSATAEGWNTTASSNSSHAEGYSCTASGFSSHAEGYSCTASEFYSHAEGQSSTASGNSSHAEGYYSNASGIASHAEGRYTSAGSSQHAGGHYNVSYAGSDYGTSDTAFIIGNGTDANTGRSNAFRVTFAGSVYGKSSYNSSGADYVEYFEWKDGNKDKSDRVGYFVTLDGDKIKIAGKDDYILGVVSAQPSVIGNSDDDWNGKWLKDDFGRRKTEKHKTEDGEEYEGWVLNPNFDNDKEYTERKDRSEWDAVGLIGVLTVRDDGTCEVDGYCAVKDGGIATASDEGYRVIKRISENIIKIILK